MLENFWPIGLILNLILIFMTVNTGILLTIKNSIKL